MSPDPARHTDHYSYAMYADSAMADTFDALRFGGPIGRFVAAEQERVIAGFLAPLAGKSVLDVGTGTGRAAIALAKRGASVTGIDASVEMLAVARRRAGEADVAVTFRPGDAHAIDVPDRSFDAVICLRVLMHTPAWRQALGELCRVARTHVVLDYPALASAAAVHAGARRIAHAAGARVQAYRVFSNRAVRRALEVNGFRVVATHRQFVLPIALHKRIGSARFTARIEDGLARAGVRRLLGSPVTVVGERCAS